MGVCVFVWANELKLVCKWRFESRNTQNKVIIIKGMFVVVCVVFDQNCTAVGITYHVWVVRVSELVYMVECVYGTEELHNFAPIQDVSQARVLDGIAL